jgi:signal transduction histidine kinase
MSDVRVPGNQEPWHVSPAHQHLVQFYETDEYLLFMLSQFVSTTLNNGEAAMVVATPDHVNRLRTLLSESGVDVVTSELTKQLTLLDADNTLNKFMVNGEPQPMLFRKLFTEVISDVQDHWQNVRVFGEMVALTAKINYATATLDLERLWNDLLEELHFSLCCAYPLQTFNNESTANMLLDVCEQHSAVFPAESFATLKTQEERFREVAMLQQKASQLETEVKQRALAQEQLHSALEAERAARQEAEGALRVRDEFVSIAAHELKTPLTSLMGRAQLALRRIRSSTNEDPVQVENLMQSVVTQAEKLSRLINQLLDVSRLKGGKLSIHRETVDLVELVHESVTSVHVGHNGHSINVNTPDRMVAEVDPIRLEQVIVNLLNNAVKYSPDGTEVQISLVWPDDHTIELRVKDEGPGVPATDRDQIFDRFYQGGHQVTPAGGMGLGLYICREIVELHGGDVLAEFPDAGGTTFIVRLPISQYKGTQSGETAIL